MAEGVAVASPRRARPRGTPTASSTTTGAARSHGRALAPVHKRQFRLPEVVLGVLLVAGCALGAVLWQRSTNTTTTVVVASRPIPRGTVIGPDDLRGAQVGGETSAMISGDSAHVLLGKIAVVDIGTGIPLTLTLLTEIQPLGADEGLTSMALAPGRLPPDLAAGDHVRIVVTAHPDPTGGVATSLLDEAAMVWSVAASPDGVATIVTIRGPISLATEVAGAADIQLVRVEGP